MLLIKYKNVFVSYKGLLNGDEIVGNTIYIKPFLENENDVFPATFEDIKQMELSLIECANYDRVVITNYVILSNEYVTTNKNVVEEQETAQIKEFKHFRCNS